MEINKLLNGWLYDKKYEKELLALVQNGSASIHQGNYIDYGVLTLMILKYLCSTLIFQIL
ncbi:hypothetical protein BCM0075_1212 [Bacillus cereus]|nr:hypothetical protein BCM0075_1212 [Bacillus cereus]